MRRPWLMYGLVLASLLVTAGVYFDGWWHVVVGRETFFTPPHLLIYAGIGGVFALLFAHRSAVPWPAWVFAAVVLLAAPFDNWWHELFGPESLLSIWVVWSPPHLIAELAMLGLFLLIARQLVRPKAGFAFTLQWAAISGLVLFILSPLELLGPYRVLGATGGLVPLFATGVLVHAYLAIRKDALTPYLLATLLIILPLNAHTVTEFTAAFPVFHEHLSLFWFFALFLVPPLIVDSFACAQKPWFKTALFLSAFAAIFMGGHALLIPGYRGLWPVVLGYTFAAWPLGWLAARVPLARARRNAGFL